ncbi:MAG: alpha-D-ribose 1-methylphosphonate 5-triphosphate diphosphatase [Rhodospirillales bacterium]|nr:alpha-D-ribose 1-methylphosphonate 5-triphosphate diphosphatase [Rhodospirillales bacterium]
MSSIDRRCAAAGITTVYHGISFAAGELGVRDTRIAEQVARAVAAFTASALVDHRVHVRYEITDPESEAIVARLLDERIAGLLSFMDHTPGQGQFKDVAAYKAYFGKVYRRSDSDLDTLIDRKQGESGRAFARVQRLAALAREHRVAIAGHDDEGRDRVDFMRSIGATISEFPCDIKTARAAHGGSLATLFGAPNVVRGKSLSGALSAREALAAGVASCLCSDYAPQAMLPAVGVLVDELGLAWPDAVRLVASNPAKAAGLHDRGEIAVGKRADLLVVSSGHGFLAAETVWCEGRQVLGTGVSRTQGRV